MAAPRFPAGRRFFCRRTRPRAADAGAKGGSRMPLHLGPCSRRSFLLKSLAGGVGLVVSRAARAAGAPRQAAEKWALLSDTHISADVRTMYKDVNLADNLRRVTAE